ncbi:MAG: DUF3306 domain-containing protein [Betaproteobacteria bacterium]|nr:DUF3306 domain-containing protein [Betaproteobacteria bacterium]
MAGEDDFLSRWSRRKSEAKDPARARPEPSPAQSLPAAAVPPVPPEPAPLPPAESLTPESDFAPFMATGVDGDRRRQALKTLFSDPRYNVMDMMDVYVEDFSKPDPIPAAWMDQLQQLSRLGDRAGRDREEEERRKALAEANGDGAAPPGEGSAEGPAGQTAASPVERDTPPGEGEELPAQRSPIPVPPLGESGT